MLTQYLVEARLRIDGDLSFPEKEGVVVEVRCHLGRVAEAGGPGRGKEVVVQGPPKVALDQYLADLLVPYDSYVVVGEPRGGPLEVVVTRFDFGMIEGHGRHPRDHDCELDRPRPRRPGLPRTEGRYRGLFVWVEPRTEPEEAVQSCRDVRFRVAPPRRWPE